jgi:hypothetical protein
MPELPRLDRLRRRSVIADQRLRVPMHDGILDTDARDRRVPAIGEQRRALLQLAPHVLDRAARRRRGEPAHAGIAKPGAGRMRDDQQIPPIGEHAAHVADDVPVRAVLGREQIARPCVEAASGEGPADDAGKFAGDEDPRPPRPVDVLD